MAKDLKDYSKQLNDAVTDIKEASDEYLQLKQYLKDKEKVLTKDAKKARQEELKSLKENYENKKKYYTELYIAQLEANKKQHTEDLLKVEGTKELGEEDLKNRIEINDKLIEEQKKLAKEIAGIDAEVDPDGVKKAAKEKDTKEWKEKWKDISDKTTEYTNTVNNALKNMFGGMTKYLDEAIAKRKEALGKVNEEIVKAQQALEKDYTLELAQAKVKAQEEANPDGTATDEEKSATTKELEELEKLYNLQLEMDAVNEERKKNAGDAAYEEMQLSETQQETLDTLSLKHASYSEALKKKTDDEKNAQDHYEDLTKEKEKLEADIEKKEKQKKKIEAAQQYIQAGVNIAQGITKALALGPIIGPIMAAVVGAAGAVQLGYMHAQINKLEDGGLLRGQRHSEGGMPILGSNIEVEGGEYVVNRQSTGKNLGLLGYINSQRRELSPADISSFFATSGRVPEPSFSRMFEEGGQLPVMERNVNVDNELMMEAIRNIKFEPKVSVTDINSVQSDVVKVDSWVGM